MKNNWVKINSDFRLRETSQQMENLPVGVYVVSYDPRADELYLSHSKDKFEFGYKLYGIETEFVERCVKTYNNTTGNLGLLLNGLKGTGKTVTGELIANALQLPIILVTNKWKGISEFINSIHDDVVIFFDEYEKIYKEYDDNILTVMDGVLNNGFRRVFILTTNEIRVNQNLLNRPSRILYVKPFQDLPLKSIIEVVDDKLVHVHFREELIKFLSSLEIITIDIVKAVISEVNIHNESPNTFKSFFNTKSIENLFNVYELVKEGDKDVPKLLYKEIGISPLKIGSKDVGEYFRVNSQYEGVIKLVLSEDDFFIEAVEGDEDEEKVTKHIMLERVDKMHKSFTTYYHPNAF